MIPEIYIASFIVTCLTVFTSLNLFNLTRTLHGRREKSARAYAEVKHPQGIIFALAALGTLVFFIESVAYAFIVFAGVFQTSEFPLQLCFQHDSYVQAIGIPLETGGYFLFLWSVLERGRYAVSWEMRENQKLVTWGPFRYIRHLPTWLISYCFLAVLHAA